MIGIGTKLKQSNNIFPNLSPCFDFQIKGKTGGKSWIFCPKSSDILIFLFEICHSGIFGNQCLHYHVALQSFSLLIILMHCSFLFSPFRNEECKSLPFLPDPEMGNNGHYKKFDEMYGKVTKDVSQCLVNSLISFIWCFNEIWEIIYLLECLFTREITVLFSHKRLFLNGTNANEAIYGRKTVLHSRVFSPY